MKKKLSILIILLLVAGGGTWLVRKQAREIEESQATRAASLAEESEEAAESSENTVSAENGMQNASSMSIDDLSITQGEEGFLLWTLTARRAHMQGEGRIQAENPFLTYYVVEGDKPAGSSGQSGQKNLDDFKAAGAEAVVPEGASVLTVKSLAGGIDRQADTMHFEERVVVVNGDNTLNSELLEYSGREKKLTSPGRVKFFSPSMNGNAGKAVLRLADNVLYAAGGVSVDWVLASGKSVISPDKPALAE